MGEYTYDFSETTPRRSRSVLTAMVASTSTTVRRGLGCGRKIASTLGLVNYDDGVIRETVSIR